MYCRCRQRAPFSAADQDAEKTPADELRGILAGVA